MSKDTSIMLKKEVVPIVSAALGVRVNKSADMVVAAEYLSKLNKIADKIEEEKQKVLAPLNLARKAEMARWKPIEDMYEDGIDHLRLAMGDFQTSEVKRQRDEEKRIADRIGDGRGKIKLDTAMRKMDEVVKVEEKVVTDNGSVKFREVQVLVIIDKTEVPMDYMLINEAKALAALKAGVIVGGCMLETKMIPVNSR